jgi:hypothetical protein
VLLLMIPLVHHVIIFMDNAAFGIVKGNRLQWLTVVTLV